jgi:hypothetical protein
VRLALAANRVRMPEDSRKSDVRRIWVALLAGVLAVPVCCYAYVAYFRWYEATVPRAPVPNGARLLSRNAPRGGYWSSNAENKYYEKYSVTRPLEEVWDFYARAGHNAWPFGHYLVHVLPPTPPLNEDPPNMNLASALRRDSSDPPGETLILLEVYWDPDPVPLSWLRPR